MTYTEAIESNPNDPALFTNRAACYMKGVKFLKAVKDCDKVISIDQSWTRARTRKSDILMQLQRYADAGSAADAGLAMEPLHANLLRLQSETRQKKVFEQIRYNLNAPISDADTTPSAADLVNFVRDLPIRRQKLTPAENERLAVLECIQKKS